MGLGWRWEYWEVVIECVEVLRGCGSCDEVVGVVRMLCYAGARYLVRNLVRNCGYRDLITTECDRQHRAVVFKTRTRKSWMKNALKIVHLNCNLQL